MFCSCSSVAWCDLPWFTLSDQLSRLHMILKPFMLRRIKKDVENELSDKVMSYRLSVKIKVSYLKYLCMWYLLLIFQTCISDWNPDILPADQQTAAALPGSKEQDLHRGPAAVINGLSPAGPQHHQQPHEPCHAVQEGEAGFVSFKGIVHPKIWFETTTGWVNYDRIFFFWLTIPLKPVWRFKLLLCI